MTRKPTPVTPLALPSDSTTVPPPLYTAPEPEPGEMPDPRFSQEVVEQYRGDPESVINDEQTPARHYIQTTNPPDSDEVKTIFSRLAIPTSEQTHLIHAGYTGELAHVIDDLGNDVIFTDALSEWVENAADTGLESHHTILEACPASLFERADVVTTYEGYLPFQSQRSTYEALRSMTTEHGLVFFESQHTREEIDEELHGDRSAGRLKQSFNIYKDPYNATVRYRERNGLRAYQLRASSDSRSEVLLDANLIVAMQALIQTGHDSLDVEDSFGQQLPVVTDETISTISNAFEVPNVPIRDGLTRLSHLSWETVPHFFQMTVPDGYVNIGPEDFAVPWIQR